MNVILLQNIRAIGHIVHRHGELIAKQKKTARPYTEQRSFSSFLLCFMVYTAMIRIDHIGICLFQYIQKSAHLRCVTQSSPSTIRKYFPVACLMPLFTVEPGPAFFCEIKRNVPGYFFSYAETISGVRSLEPSSVTRTSTRSKIAGSIKESRHCSINFSTLYAATETLSTFCIMFPLFLFYSLHQCT